MAPRAVKRGFFITLDGPEGSGKSTQAKALSRFLQKKGYDVVTTRDPGGSPIAEEIRGLLLDLRHRRLNVFSEMLLYETCRTSLVQEVIFPALDKGKIVLCDRFSDATRVYQGMAGGISGSLIRQIDVMACQGLKPDLTFILDVKSKDGLNRLKKKRSFDRMERKPLSFHEAVRQGYRDLARKEPKRIRWIPALSIQEVHTLITRETEVVLQRHFRTRHRR